MGPPDLDVLLVEDLGRQGLPARYLAAALRDAGLHAAIADAGAPGADAGIVELARRRGPALVLWWLAFAGRLPEYLAQAASLRAAGARAYLALAGPLPSMVPAELLAACPAFDGVLCGEADGTVAALARAAARACTPDRARTEAGAGRSPVTGGDRAPGPPDFGLPGVPGLAERGRSSPWPRPQPDLDRLPRPMRDGGLAHSPAGYGFATVEGSRGCYHHCTFCLPCAFYRAAGAPYRLRSVEGLVGEMAALYRRGARLFLFDDEQFLPPESSGEGQGLPLQDAREGRVAALAGELARRVLGQIAFTIKCRPDDVDAALFARLKGAGLARVYVGIESGCDATLARLGKGVTARRNAEALALLDALGIVADFRILLFHPWSTLGSLKQDLDFLEAVLPHVATAFSFHEVEVYPGTPLARTLPGQAGGGARAGPCPWTLPEPGAELARRLARFLFGAGSAHAAWRDRHNAAWFDTLVAQRCGTGRGGDNRGRRAAVERGRPERGHARGMARNS